MMLLIGALLGLFGQQAAFAAGPVWSTAAASVLQPAADEAMTDCMETMEEESSDQPCSGLTLDCIAAMGCVVALTLAVVPPVLERQFPKQTAPRALSAHLHGRTLAPEPEPPTS